jgi:hypothetical protein
MSIGIQDIPSVAPPMLIRLAHTSPAMLLCGVTAVTLPGYGYSRTRTTHPDGTIVTSVTATECPENSYNPGSNTLPCRQCPGGLLTGTNVTSAASVKACKAGPGFFFDKMVAKPCPRGTWKNATNTATACTRCPNGLTTPTVASVSQTQCVQSLPGFKVVSPGVSAAVCERNTYNAGYNTVTNCTACGTGLVTTTVGSKTENSCLAPPGVGYDLGATPHTYSCPSNTYKAGYNRKACSSCGIGFLAPAASDSKQKCYVPAGHGTIRVSADASAVIKCGNGSFGFSEDTAGVTSLPCRPCAAGMTTLDNRPGNDLSNVTNTGPIDCYVKPGFGYDPRSQAAKPCPAGTFNPGWTQDPCMSCDDGYTTLHESSISAAACVIDAGWYYDAAAGKAVPCEMGHYCLGGTATAGVTECPAGTTNARAGTTTASECDGEWVAGGGGGRFRCWVGGGGGWGWFRGGWWVRGHVMVMVRGLRSGVDLLIVLLLSLL